MIFLSYSRANAVMAAHLEGAFRRAGLRTWIDTRDLDLDGDLHAQIEDAIWNSRAFVVLRSRRARRSAWVAWELRTARRFGKPVITLARRRRPSAPRACSRRCR
jgi:hypothetical protein